MTPPIDAPDLVSFDALDAATFRQHLDEGFRIRFGDHVVDAVLREVVALGGDTSREDRSPFSLTPSTIFQTA